MARKRILSLYEFNELELEKEELDEEAEKIKETIKKVESGEFNKRLAEIEEKKKKIDKMLDEAIED